MRVRAPPAVLGGAGDPTEARVEQRVAPLLHALDHRLLGVLGALLEHSHAVGALAPLERGLFDAAFAVRVEEVVRFRAEVLERDRRGGIGHGVSLLVAVSARW